MKSLHHLTQRLWEYATQLAKDGQWQKASDIRRAVAFIEEELSKLDDEITLVKP